METEKKVIPFSGVDDATKQPNWKETDWSAIETFDEWKEADLFKIDLRAFNWFLATHPDVPVDILKTLTQRLVLDTTKRVKTDGFRFRFNGHEVMPSRNITNITGQKKNGKSQLLNILTSIALKKSPVHCFGDAETGFGTIECVAPVDKILWIDTEQGELDMEYNYMRLFNLMGLDVHEYDEKLPNAMDYGLMIVPLRPYGTEARKIIADLMIKLYNPDIVIIDGIRDLMRDINNNDEATDIANWVLRVADERDIWCVIHQNPTGGGDKIRGAIGTELANKCATTFQVSKNKNNFFKISVPEYGSRQYAGEKGVLFKYASRIELQPVRCYDVVKRCFDLDDGKDGTMKRDALYDSIKTVAGVGKLEAGDVVTVGIARQWLVDCSAEKTDKPTPIWYRFNDWGGADDDL